MKNLSVVILAAGQGTRMKSELPKVLHKAAGRPLVAFPVLLSQSLKAERTVIVVGHGRESVEQAVKEITKGEVVSFAVQKEQKGTGHAVMMALPLLRGVTGPVLILSGDVPLLEKNTITKLHREYKRKGETLAFLTFKPADTGGYGRVIKENGKAVAIREHRDCSTKELLIPEVNAGIYMINSGFLKRTIKQLSSDNDQGELYLTDLVEIAAKNSSVGTVEASEQEVAGVNDRNDLSAIESHLRHTQNQRLMKSGVTMRQPDTTTVHLDSTLGKDTELDPLVQILGKSRIGERCFIGAGCVITDSEIEDGAKIYPYSVLDRAVVGADAQVGPMGRLRPGTILRKNARVGNFVELKNTVLGEGSKANHLAYLGDGEIGRDANVGAGTIFCNYDGFSKHKTVLEDGVFIGSDSQLVAPVTVGAGAYVASGSTITKDVPPEALAIARAKQENKEGLATALKKTLLAKKKKLNSKASKGGKAK